ncbi:hypothetical protein Tco_0491873 [Tanacetum coccineum]
MLCCLLWVRVTNTLIVQLQIVTIVLTQGSGILIVEAVLDVTTIGGLLLLVMYRCGGEWLGMGAASVGSAGGTGLSLGGVGGVEVIVGGRVVFVDFKACGVCWRGVLGGAVIFGRGVRGGGAGVFEGVSVNGIDITIGAPGAIGGFLGGVGLAGGDLKP